MSNIMRSGLIVVMSYLGICLRCLLGRFIWLWICSMCTCMTWQIFELPCAHVCAIIGTMIHNVYEYIDPCFHVTT